MIYTEPLFNQISRFLSSVGLGFLLCVFYLAVKSAFRIFGSGRKNEMLSDGVFSVFSWLISFFYMVLTNNGEVRFNLVAGQLFGGLVLYFTVGKHILRLLYFIADILHGILKRLLYPVRVYFRAFYNGFRSVRQGIRHIFAPKKDRKEKLKKKKIKLVQKSS